MINLRKSACFVLYFELSILVMVAIFATSCSSESPEPEQRIVNQSKPVNKQIDFAPGLPWLNVERPLTTDDMLGKVVILDFWTYGCINCIHVLADLKKLEEKYGHQLLVIGVHTPKFDNEKNLQTLRKIVIRYGVDHPVINDVNGLLASYYGMRAWPTRVLIDPKGEVLGKVVGEGRYSQIDDKISELLAQHEADLNPSPIPVKLEREEDDTTLLSAPGKVAVNSNSIAISDSLNNRIIVTNHSGKIKHIVGSGTPGKQDGSFTDASFSSPQGLLFNNNHIYVADTGNHLLRLIDLDNDSVTTIAGNGSLERKQRGQFQAKSIGMASPWALALLDDRLFIAMAGSHQIWVYSISSKQLSRFAGSGREGILDGDVEQATFSQPSGLNIDNDWLYIADSEASAVRRVDLKNNLVETLLGTGLFDFGDRDGDLQSAKLQHVLGISVKDQTSIYLADTYNHKLKRIDLESSSVESLIGDGKPGFLSTVDGQLQLNEPGGLALYEDRLYITDTNNDRIVVYDIDSGEPRLLNIQPIQ
ncbi:MAG: redoxin domain-containing protein [Candidatus Thiodiazotropha weberae]|nr:redoxin domain-containing protein [Candidatus Thiodiazotropha lotti]MCG8010299.1 redoxin domain-containing protein [Candidatus Thiodiazotropha lotti]MCG8020233.1 redoxin domain-containing protein [Candidatus Thiodiazotropha lotti]MCW4207396.1 thioredoxin-like domain-containing protein [Candidatus Thiodiazotropha lotti]MCW4209758.1 thioredoxin-like domain-containing protein [Candidatus Thiodiazotropha lotti]